MKKTSIIAIGALVVAGLLLSSGALAGNNLKGNGYPSGQHYNLNIIGVDKDDKPVGNSNGHTMFVKLDGHTKIIMTQATEGGVFQVTDRNGLDKDGAAFSIQSGVWDVYARVLGTPNGEVDIVSEYTIDGVSWVPLGTVKLTRETGKNPQAVNINKLFYLNSKDWIFNIDGFDGYLWNYYNDNAKLCKVRFYENTTYGGI